MSKKYNITEMADEIAAELKIYTEDITEEVKAAVNTVAEECLREIKAKSPVKTGQYKKGWRKKVEYEGKGRILIRVYNAKFPGLTHLLENGHAKVGGGRVAAIPHIATAEQHAAEKLAKKVKVVIGKDDA